MATAILDSTVQRGVSELRDRIKASRARSSELFAGIRERATPASPDIEQVIAGIRGKVTLSADTSMDASPNPGLPMMAGATNKQKS